MKFDAIHVRSMPEVLVQKIVARIKSAELKPGSCLPSQRQLAKMFNVGLGTVREAIKILDIMGYLEVIRGKGTFVSKSADEKGLYLEYNFSMDEAYDPRLTHTLEEGVAIARALGADIAKVSMDLRRPRPIGASRFHPKIMNQLERFVGLLKEVAPTAQASGVRIAVENHTDAFSEEVLWVLDRVDHPFVGACVDTVNAIHSCNGRSHCGRGKPGAQGIYESLQGQSNSDPA